MSAIQNRRVSSKKNPPEIVVQGVTIRLVFVAEQNKEIPVLVRDILKNGWLRRKTA